MDTIHDQLKKRRKALKLTQEDMRLRVGMSRQQYQRLESKGNPRLDTLILVAKGLRMELMLIPQEKAKEVRDFLEGRLKTGEVASLAGTGKNNTAEDPWQGLLEEDE